MIDVYRACIFILQLCLTQFPLPNHVNIVKCKSLIIRHWYSSTVFLANISFGTSVCQWTSGPVGGNDTPGLSPDTWRESRVLRSRAKSSLISLKQINAQIICSSARCFLLQRSYIWITPAGNVHVLVPLLQWQINSFHWSREHSLMLDKVSWASHSVKGRRL